MLIWMPNYPGKRNFRHLPDILMTIMRVLKHFYKNEHLFLKENNMAINIVAIIGAGAMGTGIGQVAAANGCEVIFFDVIPETLQHSQQSLSFTMESLIVKNKISAEDSESLL